MKREGMVLVPVASRSAISSARFPFPLVAALAWFDPPADLLSAAQLLHDLDLELVSPDGAATYAGNAPAAGGARDAANTVERVVVDAPALGAWTVKVRAHHLSEAPSQAYSLASADVLTLLHREHSAYALFCDAWAAAAAEAAAEPASRGAARKHRAAAARHLPSKNWRRVSLT